MKPWIEKKEGYDWWENKTNTSDTGKSDSEHYTDNFIHQTSVELDRGLKDATETLKNAEDMIKDAWDKLRE